MTKHYKEAPWWWYIVLLVISFVLGLVVVIKDKNILPVWAYIVALLSGVIVAPFVSMPISDTYLSSELPNITAEHHSLFSLW